jgi:hypothetical protein
MARTGRKSKYHDMVQPRLDEVKEWRLQGITEIDIAGLLGIGYATLKTYKNKHDDFRAVLKEANKLMVEDIKISLFNLAKGGIKTKTVKKTYVRKDGEMVLDKIEETENVSLPNVAAAVYVTKNLDPANWSDKREYINNGDYTDNHESLLGKMREVLKDTEEEVVVDGDTV